MPLDLLSSQPASGRDLLAPEQMNGLARDVALPASAFAKGLAAAAGGAGDLAKLAGTYIDAPLAKATGFPAGTFNPINRLFFGPFASRASLPTSDQILGATKNLGLTDRSDLQPQTEPEKNISAGFQGAGSALPFAVTGGIPALASTLLGGFGGGVGARYGAQALPSHPGAGALIGSVPGALLGGGGANFLQKAVNAARGSFGELGSAYQAAGVPVRLTGDVSDNTLLKQLQAYSSKSLGGAGRVHNAADAVVNAYGDQVEGLAAQQGTSTTLQELGDKAQAGALQWLKDFQDTSTAKHTAIDNAVGMDAPVSTSTLGSTLDDIAAKARGNPEARAFLTSPLASTVKNIIDAAGGSIPWETARAIKTRLGEYLENPSLIAESGGAQAKRLYGSLNEDMKATVAQSPNPNAMALFNDANTFTKQGHDFIDDVLSKITNKPPAQAAQTILNSTKSGDQLIAPIRQQMPSVADEAAAFKLRDMALSPNGQQNAAGTNVSPGSFLTDWNALSPEARRALYADPSVMDKIQGLATISEGVKKTQQMVNTSNTGTHMGPLAMLTAAAEGGKLGYEAHGPAGAAVGALTGAAALPAANWGLSMLAANRLLAPVVAAEGAPGVLPRSALIGVNQYPIGLLNGQPSPALLGNPVAAPAQ